MRESAFRRLALAASVILVAALAGWWWLRGPRPAGPAPIASSPSTNEAALQSGNRSPGVVARPGLDGKLQGTAAELASAPDSTGKRQALALLRQALAVDSTNEASAAIRRFLDSKADAPTGQGFKIGDHGALTGAPTLRTFLLDSLGQIDPAAAAEYSRVILNSMDSPDEWAVALRNLARGDTSAKGRALLEQKTMAMLQYGPWQRDPSAGFLEAFDVAVYLGGTSLLPTLSDLVRLQDNPAVAHASFLALDRLVINHPATTLAALLASPDMLQGREQTRADYFARADVRDPQQRQVLEAYLLNPQISPTELNTFAGVYPNANFMISPNLLTPTPTPDRNAVTSLDAESLRVVQQWLADPRFAQLSPSLEKMKVRLEQFVQQAKNGQ